jgi:hypothetical protein
MTMPADTTEPFAAAPARYAAGVDRRRLDLFLSAFVPDGSLWIPARGEGSGPRVLRGHDELAQVIERIGRFDRTFHLLGQTLVEEVDGDGARGETYCVAHHWLGAGDRVEDTVMFIRYEDTYARTAGGDWRLAERRLHEDAREIRDVTAWGRVAGPVAS